MPGPAFESPYTRQKYTHPALRAVLVIFVRVGRVGHNSSAPLKLRDEGRDPASATSPRKARLVYRLRPSTLPRKQRRLLAYRAQNTRQARFCAGSES